MGLHARKPVFGAFRTIKVQISLCTHSLISDFVARLLESILSNLATSAISLFSLVSVAEKTGLSLTLLETKRQVFSLWDISFIITLCMLGNFAWFFVIC